MAIQIYGPPNHSTLPKYYIKYWQESKAMTLDTTSSQSMSIPLVWDELFLLYKDNRSFTLLLFLKIQNAHTKTQLLKKQEQSATSICFCLEMS